MTRIWIVFGTAFLFAIPCSSQNLKGRRIVVTSVEPPAASVTRVEPFGVDRHDVARIKETVPRVQMLVPIRDIPQVSVAVAGRAIERQIRGTTQDYDRGRDLKLQRGRFLTKQDLATRKNVAVLGSRDAKELFLFEDPIGRVIRFNDEAYRVVGILEAEEPQPICIPITTMRTRLGDRVVLRSNGTFEVKQYELSAIEMVTFARSDTQNVVNLVKALLSKYHPEQEFKVEID